MKSLPIRKIGSLVDLFVEACTKQPHSEVLIEIEGTYSIDSNGEFSLAALAEGDLPVSGSIPIPIDAKIEIGGGRRSQSAGVGQFKMRLYRPDYTKNPSLKPVDNSVDKGK